jgi:hypothetical protein
MNIQSPRQQKTPDLNLPGEMVEQILAHLQNAIIFAKSPDGSMRPFVDPIPISQMILSAIQSAQKQSVE